MAESALHIVIRINGMGDGRGEKISLYFGNTSTYQRYGV